MVGQLTYRLSQDEDLPSLLRLWKEETKWGELTPELWRRWYIDTPCGPALIAAVIDEAGEIVGQGFLTPSHIVLDGREVRALRISAPILRKDVRRALLRSREHPAAVMLDLGLGAARAQGYSLVYSLPEWGWIPFFKRYGQFTTVEYECATVPIGPLGMSSLREMPPLVAHQVTSFGSEYQDLWQSAMHTFPIAVGIIRSPDWLRFRNGEHLVLEMRDERDHVLVGYTAIKKQSGLLVDILTRSPNDLAPVLAATLNWLATPRDAPALDGTNCLKVMRTPVLAPALQALRFEPVEYTFAFVYVSLDPSLPTEAIPPEHWYIAPGD